MVLDTWHQGPLGPSTSVLGVTEGSAVVSAMKRAESAGGLGGAVWESQRETHTGGRGARVASGLVGRRPWARTRS